MEDKKITTIKDLTRQIKNAKRRLERLRKRRAEGPEAREAFEGAPLAQGAMEFIAYLDKEIKKEEGLIARLERERVRLRRKETNS